MGLLFRSRRALLIVVLLALTLGTYWYVKSRNSDEAQTRWHSPDTLDPRVAVNLDEAESRWVTPVAVDPKVVAWIDKLLEISEEGIGTHSTAWASGFIATDEEPKFRGGILGSQRPAVQPAMRELVKIGVAALPDLLNHVSDPRKTALKAGLTHPFFGSSWYSDEYDSRFRDAKRRQQRVNALGFGGPHGFSGSHTIRVGDLCFVAIGQIVNRQLHPVRYQPTACLVINSPVRTPPLAEAVRNDWSGLTAEKHQESLTADALRHLSYAALTRLYYYYPEVADSVALKLLERPLHDGQKARALIDDASEPTFLNETDKTDQRYLLEALAPIPSKKLDEAFGKLFHNLDFDGLKGFDRIHTDDLVLILMDRLKGKALDNKFQAYCEKRILELEQKQRELAEDHRLEFLRERLRQFTAPKIEAKN